MATEAEVYPAPNRQNPMELDAMLMTAELDEEALIRDLLGTDGVCCSINFVYILICTWFTCACISCRTYYHRFSARNWSQYNHRIRVPQLFLLIAVPVLMWTHYPYNSPHPLQVRDVLATLAVPARLSLLVGVHTAQTPTPWIPILSWTSRSLCG